MLGKPPLGVNLPSWRDQAPSSLLHAVEVSGPVSVHRIKRVLNLIEPFGSDRAFHRFPRWKSLFLVPVGLPHGTALDFQPPPALHAVSGDVKKGMGYGAGDAHGRKFKSSKIGQRSKSGHGLHIEQAVG